MILNSWYKTDYSLTRCFRMTVCATYFVSIALFTINVNFRTACEKKCFQGLIACKSR